MMFLKIASVSSLLFAGSLALALAENKSELYFQPDQGENSAEVSLSYLSYKYDIKSSGTKLGTTDANRTGFKAEYLFGLSDEMAIGGEIGYSSAKGSTKLDSQTTTSEAKSSGLNDLTFKFKGNKITEQYTLRYGGNLGLSLTKRLDPNSTTSKDGNAMSGGFSLDPYVACEYIMPDFNVGLAVNYKLLLERTSDNQASTSVESKTSGGNTLTLKPYFDWHYGSGILAGYLAFGSIAESTSTTAGVASPSGSYSTVSMGIKSSYDINPAMAGIVGLDVTSANSVPSGTIDKPSYNITTITLGGRMLF